MLKLYSPLVVTLSLMIFVSNKSNSQTPQFTLQDTLRGTINANRSWWDVLQYDITVEPDFTNKTIIGKNKITYQVVSDKNNRIMQIDLQAPLQITNLWYDDKLYINDPSYPYRNKGNIWLIPLPSGALNTKHSITIEYSGAPKIARMPPWDGGLVWKKDKNQNPFVSVACQGLGASVWYPCKDHQSDEPDNGAKMHMIIPNDLIGVSNGNLVGNKQIEGDKTIWSWEVKNPINSYNLIPNMGKYVNITDTYGGEKGNLSLSYWVLDYNKEIATKQFGENVKPMLQCFEDWFGPYPFYEDGYKLIETPYLGMEHQSGIAYGNKYGNGYMGKDLSGSGWGKDWDYIVIHESGHEWWGNNVTTKDIADMWIHEGFTTYSEVLFVECKHGKKAANEYCQGLRSSINNAAPIIGIYGVNNNPGSDIYYKGANLIHTIRQIINDDALFKNILRGIQKEFYHKTVTSQQIENYISEKAGKDFSKIFDQYLRTINIPALEYNYAAGKLNYRWSNCIANFSMPIHLAHPDIWLLPTTQWQSVNVALKGDTNIVVDKNFYVSEKKSL